MNQNLLLHPVLSAPILKSRRLDYGIYMGLGIVCLALLARLAIPLPYSPVLITGQTFGVLLLGLLYGRRLGLATIVGYVALGSLGLPVFSGGGYGFLFFSPSGGYLIGYIVAVYLCGYFAEKGWTRSFAKMIGLMFLAEAAIYLFGLIQLSFFVQGNVFELGLYPFVAGDLCKMFLVAGALPTLWRTFRSK